MDLQSKLNVSLGNEYLFELAVLIDKNKRIFQIPLFQKSKQRNKPTQPLTRFQKTLFLIRLKNILIAVLI